MELYIQYIRPDLFLCRCMDCLRPIVIFGFLINKNANFSKPNETPGSIKITMGPCWAYLSLCGFQQFDLLNQTHEKTGFQQSYFYTKISVINKWLNRAMECKWFCDCLFKCKPYPGSCSLNKTFAWMVDMHSALTLGWLYSILLLLKCTYSIDKRESHRLKSHSFFTQAWLFAIRCHYLIWDTGRRWLLTVSVSLKQSLV